MTTLPTDITITYQQQYRKCGKASCKKCKISRGHGPYWYAYWRVPGDSAKLRNKYLGKKKPEGVRDDVDSTARPDVDLIGQQ